MRKDFDFDFDFDFDTDTDAYADVEMAVACKVPKSKKASIGAMLEMKIDK